MKTSGEADRAENAKRVIEEGLLRVEGSADAMGFEVVEASFGEVLHLFRIYIVKESIDSEITTEGITLRGTSRLRRGRNKSGESYLQSKECVNQRRRSHCGVDSNR